MTNASQRETLNQYGFQLVASAHHGIYQHEIFENSTMKFVLVLDKAYHECFIQGLKSGGTVYPILDIVKALRKDENYLKSVLAKQHKSSQLMPGNCIKMLTDNYDLLEQFMRQNNSVDANNILKTKKVERR